MMRDESLLVWWCLFSACSGLNPSFNTWTRRKPSSLLQYRETIHPSIHIHVSGFCVGVFGRGLFPGVILMRSAVSTNFSTKKGNSTEEHHVAHDRHLVGIRRSQKRSIKLIINSSTTSKYIWQLFNDVLYLLRHWNNIYLNLIYREATHICRKQCVHQYIKSKIRHCQS